jgi:hypothetical protein
MLRAGLVEASILRNTKRGSIGSYINMPSVTLFKGLFVMDEGHGSLVIPYTLTIRPSVMFTMSSGIEFPDFCMELSNVDQSQKRLVMGSETGITTIPNVWTPRDEGWRWAIRDVLSGSDGT